MPIKVAIDCDKLNLNSNVNQPGLYVTETTSDSSAVIYQSTYMMDPCELDGECCQFFKPGIMTCGFVDECEGSLY